VDSIYGKTILDTGIRVVTEKIPHLRSVAIGVWILAGTRQEEETTNGIAHFLEHMVFKGTKKRNAYQIAESLESVGGHLNAFTAKEFTCFYAHILDENLPEAIEVLSDILINPTLREQDLDKERNVILEEIRNLEDTPDELIHEYFAKDLFHPHPLGFSTLGTKENVSNFSRKDLLNFMQTNYTSGRVIIAAAGNVDHQKLVDLVKKYFRFPTSPTSAKDDQLPPEKGKNTVIESDISQAHICLGTRGYSYGNPKKIPLFVLNAILGAGMSSRLFQNIREKYGFAYSVYSFMDFFADTGVFGIYIGIEKDKIDPSIELIHRELEKLKRQRVREDELDRKKSQLKGNLMLGLESTSNRMTRLAKMEIYLQKFYTLDDTLKQIDKVTATDILEIANELFVKEKIYTTILKPR